MVPDRKLYPWVIVSLTFFKIDFSGRLVYYPYIFFANIRPPLIEEIQFGFLKICERNMIRIALFRIDSMLSLKCKGSKIGRVCCLQKCKNTENRNILILGALS